MKRLLLLLFALFLSSTMVSTAFAEDYSAEQNENLKKFYIDKIKSRCKTEFKLSVDTKSFEKALAKDSSKKSSLFRYCGKPLDIIAEYCALGFGQKAVKKIKSYQCKYKAGEPQISLKGGVLTMTHSMGSRDKVGKIVKVKLGKTLKHGKFTVAQAYLISEDEKRLKGYINDISRSCEGYKLKWKVDWKSFTPALDKRLGSNNLRAIWQECYDPVRAIMGRCNNGQTDLVKKQIKSYTCRYGEPSMTLKGGKLVHTSDLTLEKPISWTKDHLGDVIKDGEFSARQMDFIKEENADFKRLFSDAANSACGTKIEWKIDWKSLEGEMNKRLSKEDKTSIYDACGVPMNRLSDVCRENKAAPKVKKKIKSYVCEAGGKKPKLTLKKGKFTYKVSFGAKDVYGFVDKFLVKKKIVKKRPAPKKLSPKDLAKIRRIIGQGAKVSKCYKGCRLRCSTQSCIQKCRNRCN